MAKEAVQQGTWAIKPPVRRILKSTVLELRAALEDDFGRQLRGIGIHEDGSKALPPGRKLTVEEEHLREVASAVIDRETAAGSSMAQAWETYVGDSVFTFLNRMVGLRCLEERGLLFVEGQTETVITMDPARNASSLYWRVRNELGPQTQPREVWRETLRRASAAISERVKVLFDPESEYAALLPLQPALKQIIDALNSPSIPSSVYAEDEFLGWIYQYYNASEKDAAYAQVAKGKKLEQPSELIAATCLYTERYMVDYLLQNTLGTLWVEMHPESKLPEHWPYFVRPLEGEVTERPVRPLRDITVLDPACGSGHFLVRAFDLLVQMYREEGREAESVIPHLIIERNLHGIDIDLRAVQIAALGLFLKACALAGPAFQPLRLNLIAADALLSGEEPPVEYMAKLKADPLATAVVKSIWPGLRNVREIGSLLHPERALEGVVLHERQADPLHLRDDAYWGQWKSELLQGLEEEFDRQAASEDLGQRLFGKEAAKGIGLVGALGRKYDVVVTNPPYAGSRNLSSSFKAFIEREYSAGKRDLYAAFVQRVHDFSRPDGYFGMVTQRSWLFFTSFIGLRQEILSSVQIASLAHLGPHAFEEIGGERVNVALCTFRASPGSAQHHIAAFRLIGINSPPDKEQALRNAVSAPKSKMKFAPLQTTLASIPGIPFVYWLTDGLASILSHPPKRFADVATTRYGMNTADNDRFVRLFWEGPRQAGQWVPYSKGGGYSKWAGMEWCLLDWTRSGDAIRETSRAKVQNAQFYFTEGVSYSLIAQGALGARHLPAAVAFDSASITMFPLDPQAVTAEDILAAANCRITSYFLRVLSGDIQFNPGYVDRTPFAVLPAAHRTLIGHLVEFKEWLTSQSCTERTFSALGAEVAEGSSLLSRCLSADTMTLWTQAWLHTLEAESERAVFSSFVLSEADLATVLEETGTPAGWWPFVTQFDTAPSPLGAPWADNDLSIYLANRPPSKLPIDQAEKRASLRLMYVAGPGATPDLASEQPEPSGDDTDDGGQDLGAHLPIPNETFLENLSQRLEIHPISVYGLLKDMRDKEGLVCAGEMRRSLEDYATVTILRLLGYRWPEQDAYERDRSLIVDSALIDDDGIIPLLSCSDEPTGFDLLRSRLESEFGPDGADRSEAEFGQWVGRDFADWLRRDFFKRHIQQFRQRPVAWHLVSPDRTFEAFVLYHKLSRATLQRLRGPQYAGGLITRLKGEQERARQRGDTAEVNKLQLQVEDVEEFCERIEKIERGDELKYRIRCRWKGEEKEGRPGPYAPDIDDGVKVNIRPFQEAGLLAVKEVIKKW